MPDFALELEAGADRGLCVCGVDEVGRGPWAGPVVVAAVILNRQTLPGELAARIDDSKALSRPEREALFDLLPRYAQVAVVKAEVAEIDRINILQASLRAMARAVRRLPTKPVVALVDGNIAPKRMPCRVRPVVKGDALSLSIAAASIIAKVTRDRLMNRLARRYPGYGWDTNVGYGTREHRAALARLGCTPHHRQSFRPVWERLALEEAAWVESEPAADDVPEVVPVEFPLPPATGLEIGIAPEAAVLAGASSELR